MIWGHGRAIAGVLCSVLLWSERFIRSFTMCRSSQRNLKHVLSPFLLNFTSFYLSQKSVLPMMWKMSDLTVYMMINLIIYHRFLVLWIGPQISFDNLDNILTNLLIWILIIHIYINYRMKFQNFKWIIEIIYEIYKYFILSMNYYIIDELFY